MPILKTFLPDVNVWLALASRRHVHSQICSTWLNRSTSEIGQLGDHPRLCLQVLPHRRDLGREVDLTQPITPRTVFGQVTFDILNQTPDLFPPVIACDFVVCVPEESLDGVGLWAIGGQKH